MSAAMPSPAKVCTRCGQDCAGKPRVKDRHGRYTCRPCYDQLKAERVATQLSPAPTAPAAPVSAARGEPEGFDVFALEPGAEDTRMAPCRNCGAPLAESAVLCVSCGFNKKLGRVIRDNDIAAPPPLPPTAPKPGRRIACGKCGYDLRGITGIKCPECGASALGPSRHEKDKEDSEAVAREAYIKPLVYFAIGFGVVSLIQLFSHGPMHAVAYAIGYAIQVPIGVAVFWVCCLVWIGFDAPIHLTALRLAGIYALVDLAGAIFEYVPVPLVGWAVPLFIYIGLLMDLLEMDLQDAVIVALITFLVRTIITFFVVAKIYGLI